VALHGGAGALIAQLARCSARERTTAMNALSAGLGNRSLARRRDTRPEAEDAAAASRP
jgi:hypothetical protein